MERVDINETKSQPKESSENENNQSLGLFPSLDSKSRHQYRINDYSELDNITSDWTLGGTRALELLREAEDELEREE